MQINAISEQYSRIRYRFFKWRSGSAVINKTLLAFGGAVLMGLLAQVKIFLPWTPVPIVGTQLGVVLAAALLGRNWGGISAAIYVAAGVAGIPWFAGMTGGIGTLFGPTGGYLFGFILAALFVGYMIDKFAASRRFFPLLGIMLTANLILIYVPGLIQLGLWLSLIKGKPAGIPELLWLGAVPFIIGDMIKSVAGALLISMITPKKDYIEEK